MAANMARRSWSVIRFSKNMTSLQLLKQRILLKTSSMCTEGKWIHSWILVTISKFGNKRICLALDLSLNKKIKS